MVYIIYSPEAIHKANDDTLPTRLYVDSNSRNSVCRFGVGLPLSINAFDVIKLYSALLNLI